MDRWGVLRRFGQSGQVSATAAAAAEEPKREDLWPPPPPVSQTAKRFLEEDYGAAGTMAPQRTAQPPPQLQLPAEQPGNVAPIERGPAVGISGKPEARSWAVAHPRVNSKGDYLGVSYRPRLVKLLARYGDSKVLFADKVLKFTGTGKAKRRGLVITDSAMYLFDPETDVLKRRILLKAIGRLCLSELTDHFLAFIVPSEYDLLLASTRKKEIAQVAAEVTKEVSGEEVEIAFSSSFEYRPSVQVVKEVIFQDLEEGGIKTRILRKQG